MYRFIHFLAVVMITILLVVHAASYRNFSSFPLAQQIFQFIVGIALWGLFLYKIWKKPKSWGLGLGIFFLLLIPFQTFLWYSAVNGPMRDTIPGGPSIVIFLLYESPLFIGAICCVLLRFTSPPSQKVAEENNAVSS
jgi:hypothetical protein